MSTAEIKERLKRIVALKKKIEDLKHKWEEELMMYVVNESDYDIEIKKNISLMIKIEQKILLKHIKELEILLEGH
jgi:hypothetical protein